MIKGVVRIVHTVRIVAGEITIFLLNTKHPVGLKKGPQQPPLPWAWVFSLSKSISTLTSSAPEAKVQGLTVSFWGLLIRNNRNI